MKIIFFNRPVFLALKTDFFMYVCYNNQRVFCFSKTMLFATRPIIETWEHVSSGGESSEASSRCIIFSFQLEIVIWIMWKGGEDLLRLIGLLPRFWCARWWNAQFSRPF
ncbi:unnamed protein product [Amoebophrya sp. A120]|nr:unnamed protein product [Amoebophrya sp. A120]|eukprot:GSA120T00019790001.1